MLRAAGAFAETSSREIGHLCLLAAVDAGLRRQDGIAYRPDRRIVPKNPHRVRTRLHEERDALSRFRFECRSNLNALLADVVFGSTPVLPNDWDDAGPWAELAVRLRPTDPFARLTFAATFLRGGHLAEAEREIDCALEITRACPDLRARALRNKAAAIELRHGPRAALSLVEEAARLDPFCLTTRRDLRAYRQAAT